MESLQKGPTRHTYAWQLGPFWQDTLDIFSTMGSRNPTTKEAMASVARALIYYRKDSSANTKIVNITGRFIHHGSTEYEFWWVQFKYKEHISSQRDSRYKDDGRETV